MSDDNSTTRAAATEEQRMNAMVQQESAGILAVIERASNSPDTDVVKLEKLLDMYERIESRRAETEFAAAMTRVQAQLPTVVKDAYNEQTRSNYARLERLSQAIKPIYTKEGFSAVFSEDDCPKDGHIRIVATLRHSAGHKERHHVDVAIDSTGIKGTVNKTLTHAGGSTYSYGRRYLTCMMFDVATGDDTDGNSPPEEIQRITPEQVAELDRLLTDTGSDKAKFLKYVQAERLEEIQAGYFDECLKVIRRAADARSKQEAS